MILDRGISHLHKLTDALLGKKRSLLLTTVCRNSSDAESFIVGKFRLWSSESFWISEFLYDEHLQLEKIEIIDGGHWKLTAAELATRRSLWSIIRISRNSWCSQLFGFESWSHASSAESLGNRLQIAASSYSASHQHPLQHHSQHPINILLGTHQHPTQHRLILLPSMLKLASS